MHKRALVVDRNSYKARAKRSRSTASPTSGPMLPATYEACADPAAVLDLHWAADGATEARRGVETPSTRVEGAT